MSLTAQHRLAALILILMALPVFLAGVDWGLPSREPDRFLFAGQSTPWTGKKIIEAGGPWKPDSNLAADQASTRPSSDQSTLNASEKDQAQIIRRYRLFSNQPDEMVTFMALSQMRGSLDPRMYQYGGLWIYPVGALLKAGSILGRVEVTSDLSTYLDRPAAFGRFYVIARCYSALWGLVGVWAVYTIARKICGGIFLPACAAGCFIFMPAVVNAAHEAKPHLAGAVLVLLAALAGARYIERRRKRDLLLAGAICGLAMGMVLSGIVAFLILPVMVLLRRQPAGTRFKHLLVSAGAGLLIYGLTNPFVFINLIQNRAVLASNLGTLAHAKAIVGSDASASPLRSAGLLIAEGASPAVAVIGALSVAALAAIAVRRRLRPLAAPTALLLAAPMVATLVQFTMLAGGKSGEFGRFGLLVDIGLTLGAAAGLNALLRMPMARTIGGLCLLALTIPFGLSYVAGFREDVDPAHSTRTRAAIRLSELAGDGKTIAIEADPAPYNLPPIELTSGRWKLRVGSAAMAEANVIVRPVDSADGPIDPRYAGYVREVITPRQAWLPNRISWASKPVEILVREKKAGEGERSQ